MARQPKPGDSVEVNVAGLYFGWCESCGKVVLGLSPADSCPHCHGEIEHIRDVDFDEDADEARKDTPA
jgi:Zn finger protein HypA/HybF involved in hydrogenase expression